MELITELVAIGTSIITLLCLPLLYIYVRKIKFDWKSFFKGMFIYFILRFFMINVIENLFGVLLENKFYVLFIRILISAVILFIINIRFQKNDRNDPTFFIGYTSAVIVIDIIRILSENFYLILKLGVQITPLSIMDYLLLILSTGIALITLNAKNSRSALYFIILTIGYLCLYIPGNLFIIAIAVFINALNYKLTGAGHE